MYPWVGGDKQPHPRAATLRRYGETVSPEWPLRHQGLLPMTSAIQTLALTLVAPAVA